MARILGAILILLTGGMTATITAQPEDHRIAFNSLENQKNDDYEVYTINADGSDRKNITKNADVAWVYYAWKDRLFFASDRNACRRCYFLYESDIDGSNVRKVSNLQLEDSWMGSRDNGKEMIVSGRIGTAVRYQLFIVDIETGNFRQLTSELSAAFLHPIFSPDGRKIAYVYKKDRKDRSQIEELYVMNAGGGLPKKLTTYPADDPMAKESGYKVGPPHWNPKYNFITYQSEQKGTSSIYAVTPDGKRQWKLTENKKSEGYHAWSSDGTWLAFDVRDESTGRYDIYLMNYKTKAVTIVTGASPMTYHQAPVFLKIR